MNRVVWLMVLGVLSACGDETVTPDGGSRADAATAARDAAIDGAAPDAQAEDAASGDAGEPDAAPDAAAPEETRFSFVVLPDTQNEILNDTTSTRLFDHRVAWIADHAEELRIRFVAHTGDLVNWDTPTHDQYVRASRGYERFDADGIPFMIAIGNHDTAATCPGGSACTVPGMTTNDLLRDTSTFNEYFPEARFTALGGVFEEGKVDNSFHLVRAGGVDWMIIALELWARTAAYEWAGDVIEAHPDHNVIVITHSHLTAAGAIRGDNGGYGNNSPRRVFDEVLSQHANVRLVFSGHEGQAGFREDTGARGNTVYQFLNSFHDTSTNLTRIVEIDTEAGTLDTHVYGPSTDETRDGEGATVHLTDIDWVR